MKYTDSLFAGLPFHFLSTIYCTVYNKFKIDARIQHVDTITDYLTELELDLLPGEVKEERKRIVKTYITEL